MKSSYLALSEKDEFNGVKSNLFNQKPLFVGSLLKLLPLNIEKDAPVVSGWTYQLDVVSHLVYGRANPMTIFEVRKVMENWLKDVENSGHTFVFGLHPLNDERLIGLFWLTYVQWVHNASMFNLVIGDGKDWDLFAREALDLALNYAFDELNLFHLSVQTAEDDAPSCALYQQAQLSLEVRQRQAIYRNGGYVDSLLFGMLSSEWEAVRAQEASK